MSAYSNLVLATSGLISYWRLGEASGAVVDLKSGHDGTVTAATYGQAGLLAGDTDKALLFDADGDKVVIADHADFALTTGISIEAWIEIDSGSTSRCVFSRRTTGGAGGYRLEMSSATALSMTCTLTGAGDQGIAITGLTTATTYHVVGTFNGAFIRIYLNGALFASHVQDWTGFPMVTPANTVTEIGHESSGNDRSWRGVIDEVAIYNVALSPATIAAHYALGHNGPPSRINRQFQLRPY